jgi:hypothetical protein
MGLTNSNQLALQVMTNSSQQQKKQSPFTASHVRIMDILWPNLWISINQLATMDNPRFVTWCRKLEHLSLAEFGRGFENVEEIKAVAAQKKETSYPPDYATFIGHTRKSADVTASMQAIQARSAPLLITKQLTDEEREYGTQQAAALKGLFA